MSCSYSSSSAVAIHALIAPCLLLVGAHAVSAEPDPQQVSGDASSIQQPATGASSLEEVIVTAQKREESLQKTPIAITAFGGEALQDLRITDVMDLADAAPSVMITPFAGSRATPNTFIRGMGNIDHQMTKDNAVGIYIDGVPVGRNQGLSGDVADLERVEILRGPQGTLYGRNSTAGAINLITVKPREEFEFQQELGAGNYDLFWGRTTLNLPLSDRLLMRAVYMRGQKDGWVDNTNNTLPDQTDFNMEDKEAGRISLRFLASDDFTADYSFDYSDFDYGNVFFQVVEGPTAQKDRQESTNVVRGLSPSNALSRGHSLTLQWDVGPVTLKSISGYRYMDSLYVQDYINRFSQDVQDFMETWSQEVQLIGEGLDDRLQYVAGLFYYDEDGSRDRPTDFVVVKDHSFVEATSKSQALYAQATWTPAVLDDRLRLTLGGRYTKDERKATKVFIDNDLTTVPDGTTVSGDKEFSKFNPAFTVEYEISEDINSYARYATGYRAGGFNSSSPPEGFANGFEPEDVESFELGLKADFWQGRARLNIAAYINEYSDLQVDQVRSPSIFLDTVNAGEATMQGFEIEATAQLTRGLTANLSYGFLDAEYDKYLDNGVDKAKLGTVSVAYAPDYTYAAGLKYEGEPTSYGTFSIGLDVNATDEFYSGANPLTSLNDGHTLWNARAELAEIPLKQGTLSVRLWGKNLLDEDYTTLGSQLGLLSYMYGDPRTYGLDFAYSY